MVWNPSDLERVCREYGVECNPPRSGGSHYTIVGAGIRLTIPARRPIKPVYIRALAGLIRKTRVEIE
jgi:hypothetical protein